MGDRASEVWPNGVKPQVGDFATAKSVGRKGRAIHVWEACPQCGCERWIKRNARGTLCQGCAHPPIHRGASNNRWNESKRTVTKSGVRVYMTPDHSHFAMAHKCGLGYAILEHRLVMAKSIGRYLEPWEVVHHIDGNNCNNELSNLLLLPHRAMHSAYTFLQMEVRDLKARVTLLEAENVLLQAQLSLGQGNPELAEGHDVPRASVETLYCPPHEGEEKVHPGGKSPDIGASQAQTPAALVTWRCKNAAKSGNAKHSDVQANPELADGLGHRASVETLHGALRISTEAE